MLLYKYIIFIFVFGFTNVLSQRTKDKMYNPILGASCFRRLNSTHSTGCSSKIGGSTGVLHLITIETDFDFILNNPPAPPYAVIIPPHLFSRKNVMRLKDSHYVSGIVLINATNHLTQFSQELNCPNANSGLKQSTCNSNEPESTWNPFGTGLLHEDFPFPIYFVSDPDEVDKILLCYDKFNKNDLEHQHERSLCSIEINAFMSAAVSSEVCLRRTSYTSIFSNRRYCDPLAGQNSYATIYPRKIVNINERKIDKSERFIVLSARIDTTSMFDGIGLGAMDSFVSYATLINTAHSLSHMLLPSIESEDAITTNNQSNNRNVLFILFNGEIYDYIGSQRIVYDMKKGNFPSDSHRTNPINMENIDLFVDIGALDDLNSITLYHASEFDQVNKFKNIMDNYNKKFNLKIASVTKLTQNLPPTSSQSFLRENITFPAIIINSNATNRYYHSIYDDLANIRYKYYNTTQDFTVLSSLNDASDFPIDSIQMHIRNISSAIALTLYEMISGNEYELENGANPVLADELLYCFLISSDCSLLKAASPPNSQNNLPIPLLRYISVTGSYTHSSVGWTYRILGLLIGQQISMSKDDCNYLPYYWYNGYNGTGECHYTTQNLTSAISPAFIDEDYDWSTGRYSTWTESTWKELNARIFLKPSASHEAFNLAIGFIVMLISFVLIFLINSRSDVLFGDALSTLSESSVAPAQC